jgi:TonB family protein
VDRRILIGGISGAALLAACSSPPPADVRGQGPAASLAPHAAAAAPLIPPLTLDAYKRSVAERVSRASPDVFAEPVPEMLKSIVVLDITIAHDGTLMQVSVRRSNGYQALERKAVESIRRAAPFGAPAFSVRGRDGSVRYLETFLFRDDGRFRIRSLVERT